MDSASLLALTHNAALLLAMIFIYDLAIDRKRTETQLCWKLVTGISLGITAMVIMLTPWEFAPGIIFDTRSVLLGIAGLFFGTLPTVIAMVMAAALRIYQGGAATLTGVSVIVASGLIGICWRYFRFHKTTRITIGELYLFGLAVHLAMLALMFTLPKATALTVLTHISLPVLVIYPLATTLLGTLFTARLERKQTEESMQLASMVYDNSSEAMMVMDAVTGNIITINPAFTELTQYTPEEIIGQYAGILSTDSERSVLYANLRKGMKVGGRWRGETWCRRKNGEDFIVWLTMNTIFDSEGKPYRRVGLFSDITDKKLSEEIIWNQANFDQLTQLPNRRMFLDHLEQEIRKSARARRPLALLFLDLDLFKEVNDSLGHDMGDRLLQETAKRLRQCVRDTDIVARLGGDEFTVIISNLEHTENVDRIAETILRRLSEPFHLGTDTAYISTSIGITLYPNDARDVDTLLKNADQAMYAAKNQGRNRFNYFTASMQEAARNRMLLIKDLRCAISEGQFILHYQPIVDMVSNTVTKAEALIRWQHPTRGLVSPDEFISLAEDTGMIVDIGNWVFHEALSQVARWRDQYQTEIQISVNKSPVQFRDEGSGLSHWFRHLQQLGLSGNAINIEITEGLLLDANNTVHEKLLAFRDAGIQVALDDFGTGYSSLAYLKKFDIDYLKIDKSFVRNLHNNAEEFALCEAIIVMAHKLGIKVVAEGVETPQQRDLLAAAGCDFAQGYLFSRPLPADEFARLFLIH